MMKTINDMLEEMTLPIMEDRGFDNPAVKGTYVWELAKDIAIAMLENLPHDISTTDLLKQLKEMK